jgi:hypothetical protein
MACYGGGIGGFCGGGVSPWWPATVGNTLAAVDAAGEAGVRVVPGANPAPPVQIQAFQPAFWTPEPVFAAIPYSPPLISVVTPTYSPGAAARVITAAGTGLGSGQGTGIAANECGCCTRAYSPLAPSGVEAWRATIYEANNPVNALLAPSCSGGRWFK